MKLYQRADDTVWETCRDKGGIVHWRMYYESGTSQLPMCWQNTTRRVLCASKNALPTCVFCVLAPMKPITR